jgi:hypothetical protein
MGQLYQDAMAKVHKFGKPDLFVMFTYHPNGKKLQMRFSRGKLPRITLS